ncbi:MAG: flp pilus-assembly TadE/G-like family protein [Propionibacteriaceae bacterium]|nr:flp pilus-assembly TadE/G-like family protein [Propionibacteriaceae bacterium]
MRRRDERGGGSVLIAGVCFSLLSVAVGVVVIMGWLATAERAQAAADLTALAAAGVISDGGDGCEAARATARDNEARLTDCQVRGERPRFVVEVTVALPLRTGLGLSPGEVGRTATAGSV